MKHEIVLTANDNPVDNFLAFFNTETYSIIQKIKLDGTDPNGTITLSVPPSGTSRVVKVLMSGGDARSLEAYASASPAPEPPSSLTRGGPRRWPEILETRPTLGRDDGPFAVDVLTLPESNPWLCQMRPSGFDFLPDGRLLVAG